MNRVRIAAVVLTILVAAGGTAVLAQTPSQIAVTRADIQADRQAIVAANMPMTEEQSKAFWPLYREYRAELAKPGDRIVALLENYAKNYANLSDDQAKGMVDEMFAIQGEQLKIKKAWVPKFAKVLPPKLVARFVQIENKLDVVILYELAEEIPLVKAPGK